LELDVLDREYAAAIREFSEFVSARGRTAIPAVINVIAVPRAVLCDPATSTERGARNPRAARCADWIHYYRPLDRTLVVVDDAADLGRALRLGLADYFVIHHVELAAEAKAFGENQGK